MKTGWTKIIQHLAVDPKTYLTNGRIIEKGTKFADAGNTGECSGVCVHLGEINNQTTRVEDFYRQGDSNTYQGGNPVDPEWWVNEFKNTNQNLKDSLDYMVSDGEYYVAPKKHLGKDESLKDKNNTAIVAPFKLVIVGYGTQKSFGNYILFQEIYEDEQVNNDDAINCTYDASGINGTNSITIYNDVEANSEQDKFYENSSWNIVKLHQVGKAQRAEIKRNNGKTAFVTYISENTGKPLVGRTIGARKYDL